MRKKPTSSEQSEVVLFLRNAVKVFSPKWKGELPPEPTLAELIYLRDARVFPPEYMEKRIKEATRNSAPPRAAQPANTFKGDV